MSAAPLDGIVVVSVEQAVSAPLASRYLAELGATVIKVERPEGDFARGYDDTVAGQATYFVWANRGKHSVVLDLQQPSGLERLRELIAGADVFLQNLAPESAARLGINAAAVRVDHPELVACDISGYGPDGPRSGDKAYDLAIQAEAGVFAVTGGAEMSKAGVSIADIATAQLAVTSILAALLRRGRDGVGAEIQATMLDALVDWVAPAVYGAAYSGQEPMRSGRRHHSIAPYGTFQLADGSTVLIAVQNEREWQRLAREVLDSDELATSPDFAGNQARFANVDRLEQLMSEALQRLPADHMRALLADQAITTADVNSLQQVWQHPQLRARGRFQQVPLPGGTAELLRSPFDISGMAAADATVPALGDHDSDVIQQVVARGRAPRSQ